jgi:hypothetical protein
MELQLMASGLSRTQARERINKIKGTPGAVPEAGTTDSVGAELVGPLSDLLQTIAHRSIRTHEEICHRRALLAGARRAPCARRRVPT